MLPAFPATGTALASALASVQRRGIQNGRAARVRSHEVPTADFAAEVVKTRPAISRRQEVLDLRELVGQLTEQLERLQAASDAHLPGSPTVEEARYVFDLMAQSASQWELGANRELAKLRMSQAENAQLREVVAQHAQYVKQLKRSLTRHVKSWSDDPQLSVWQLDALSSGDANGIFRSLDSELDVLYADVDRLFADVRMATLPCPGRRIQTRRSVSSGVVFELLDTNAVPFGVRQTDKAVWVSCSESGLRYRHGLSVDIKACAGTNQHLLIAFAYTIDGIHSSTLVRAHRVARMFVEAERTVIVSQTLMEPLSPYGDKSLGLHILESSVQVVRAGELRPTDISIVESYVRVTRLWSGRENAKLFQADDHIDIASSCWSRMKTLDNQLVENLLVSGAA